MLIKEIEARPVLWNHTHPQYNHRTKMKEEWMLIAEKLNLPCKCFVVWSKSTIYSKLGLNCPS